MLEESGPVANLEVYDPVTDTWSTKANMLTSREGLAAAAIDGKLYVAGGANGPTGIGGRSEERLSTVERYDPSANVWEEVAPMIKARSGFVLCSFD